MTFVDGLRGIAALSVVATHTNGILFAGSRRPGDYIYWLSNHIEWLSHGVDIFFVISGFVIAHSIANSRVNISYALRFALRRSMRLDPPYWVAIVLMLMLILLRREFGNEKPSLPSAGTILAHLLYCQGILGYPQIVAVFWTLCLEVQFYLVFVVTLMILNSVASLDKKYRAETRAWTIAILFSISLLWAAGVFPTSNHVTPWFWSHWHKFLLGALIWYASAGYVPQWMLYAPTMALGLAISIRRPMPDPNFALGLWVGMLTGAAFVLAVKLDGLYRWLSWKPLQLLGVISYSVYLVHVPLIDVTLGIQKRIVDGNPAGAIVACVILILASTFAGFLMNLTVERPSLRIASRFKPKNDDLSGGIEGPANAFSPLPV